MSKIVIKKRISFAFLGDDYKDAYGVFKSVPLTEYPEINETIDAEQNSIAKTQMMLSLIKKKFIEGRFPNEEGKLESIATDDLDGSDADLLLGVYNRLMGGGDPKVSAT